MTTTNLQALQTNTSSTFQLSSTKSNATESAAADTDTTTESCAQALYGATEELWCSIEVLGHILLNPSEQTGLNLEIAYTIFADSVCDWEAAYTSFVNSGGEPDEVSETINSALTETLPDGGSIYSLSQTVASDPADWEELQEGVSNETLNSLFEDVDAWIDADSSAGSEGFNPTINFNAPTWAIICTMCTYLKLYIEEGQSDTFQVLKSMVGLSEYFSKSGGDLGPLASCINDLINTSFFEYNGQDYSLVQIGEYWMIHYGSLTSEQRQAASEALDSCLVVLAAYLELAYRFMLSQS